MLGKGNEETDTTQTANAGIVNTSPLTNVNASWIVDSGASDHMTSDLGLLYNCHAVLNPEKNKDYLPTGNVVSVTHKGNSSILNSHPISNVLVLPDFNINLLSVSKLTKELQCSISFFPNFCIFQDLSTSMVKGIGREDHGLYILQSSTISQTPQPSLSHNQSVNTAQHLSKSSILWHKRMGHAPLEVIKKHASLRHLKSISHICLVCPLAKHTKLPFSLSCSRSKSAFELLHCDIWGPYRVPTHDSKRFFVTVVDDFTRFTWLFLIESKTEDIVVLRKFLTEINNVFSTSVEVLRTDNGL